MDMARIDDVVELGTTEVWEVRNASGTPHNFHPHDVRFRVVEYAGGPPPVHLQGLKDTVYVPPGEIVRLVTEFQNYTDADPLHVPLPRPPARGPRDDGPVHRGRAMSATSGWSGDLRCVPRGGRAPDPGDRHRRGRRAFA
jgi:hypothetical protein